MLGVASTVYNCFCQISISTSPSCSLATLRLSVNNCVRPMANWANATSFLATNCADLLKIWRQPLTPSPRFISTERSVTDVFLCASGKRQLCTHCRYLVISSGAKRRWKGLQTEFLLNPADTYTRPMISTTCRCLCCCCAVTDLLWDLGGTITSIIASAFQLLTVGIFQKVPTKSFRVLPETLNLGLLSRAKWLRRWD